MSTEAALQTRSGSTCELCTATNQLTVYQIPPSSSGSVDDSIYICETCREQIENPDQVDAHHWHCLTESMWSQVPAVQVMAWRMLNRLSAEGWAQNALDMLYLEDDVLAWAKTGQASADNPAIKHVDSNGAELSAGDTITLIKDLKVKGGNFTAKRGTAVRGISLVPDIPEHIEGRVNGQQIVILTQFVKKSSG